MNLIVILCSINHRVYIVLNIYFVFNTSYLIILKNYIILDIIAFVYKVNLLIN